MNGLLRTAATAAIVSVVSLTCGSDRAEAQQVINLSSVTFVPPHIFGDGDFDGNGPKVTLRVTLFINPNHANELMARVYMHAQETECDFTTAEGFQDFVVASRSYSFCRILSNPDGSYGYIDDDHPEDIFVTPDPLFQRLIFVGDTSGDEAGTRTKVTIEFSPVTVL
jgi:hypothetical protein